MVAISLSFQSFTLLFINLSNSLVIVLLLMPPLCGMLFQMRFVPLPPWPLSESCSKPTCAPKHTHLSLDHRLAFSMVLDCSYVSGYWNFVGCFLFCCALESSCMGRLSAIKVKLELVKFTCKLFNMFFASHIYKTVHAGHMHKTPWVKQKLSFIWTLTLGKSLILVGDLSSTSLVLPPVLQFLPSQYTSLLVSFWCLLVKLSVGVEVSRFLLRSVGRVFLFMVWYLLLCLGQ